MIVFRWIGTSCFPSTFSSMCFLTEFLIQKQWSTLTFACGWVPNRIPRFQCPFCKQDSRYVIFSWLLLRVENPRGRHRLCKAKGTKIGNNTKPNHNETQAVMVLFCLVPEVEAICSLITDVGENLRVACNLFLSFRPSRNSTSTATKFQNE